MKTTFHSWSAILCFAFLFASTTSINNRPNDETVLQLLEQCASGEGTEVYRAIGKLTNHKKSEFDNVAQAKLASLLQPNTLYLDRLVKLAGFIGLQDALNSLNQQELKNKILKTAINLALARTGDRAKMNLLMRNVKKQKVDDNFTLDLLPTLTYVRQKEVFDYLFKLIEKNDKNCHPSDAETKGNIPCAYRILEAVAANIIDFPVETDRYGLKTNDYPEALRIARQWIRENRGTYELDVETY